MARPDFDLDCMIRQVILVALEIYSFFFFNSVPFVFERKVIFRIVRATHKRRPPICFACHIEINAKTMSFFHCCLDLQHVFFVT